MTTIDQMYFQDIINTISSLIVKDAICKIAYGNPKFHRRYE